MENTAQTVSYDTTTLAEYITFQTAYDHFNSQLWKGKLPNVLITMQRKKGALGYFSPDRFSGRGFKGKAHELAMNPDHFAKRDDKSILSTLVHEMAHVWEQEFGKPPRGGYHGRKWANEMLRIGLHPSDSGCEGGKETGQKVSHYVAKGGDFELAYTVLAATGLKLKWESKSGPAKVVTAKRESKVKYTCPHCESNAWAKPDTSLICGTCFDEDGESRHMIEA
jgi:predicted SprT family Zn-dependent metalloprotease